MRLVFGGTGQVGQALKGACQDEVFFATRSDADLSYPKSCSKLILEMKPSMIINAAAWTNVDGAEDHEADAFLVNADAPYEMALAAKKLDIPLIHFSTEYVFDGRKSGFYSPDDRPNPLNAYGRTKLLGEQAILAASPAHAILRTSWVYSEFGKNFVKTMLNLSKTKDQLSIVSDQVGAPTSAHDLARTSLSVGDQLLENPEKSGIYHCTGSEVMSWAGFARRIFQEAGISMQITDISSSEFPVKAERPKNSRLDCSDLQSVFSIDCMNHRLSLGAIIDQSFTPTGDISLAL